MPKSSVLGRRDENVRNNKIKSTVSVVPTSIQTMVSNLKANQRNKSSMANRSNHTKSNLLGRNERISRKKKSCSNKHISDNTVENEKKIEEVPNNSSQLEKHDELHERGNADIDDVFNTELHKSTKSSQSITEPNVKDVVEISQRFDENEGYIPNNSDYDPHKKNETHVKKMAKEEKQVEKSKVKPNRSSQISCLYDWNDDTIYEKPIKYNQGKSFSAQSFGIKCQNGKANVDQDIKMEYRYKDAEMRKSFDKKTLSLINGASPIEQCEKLQKELKYRAQLRAQIEENKRIQIDKGTRKMTSNLHSQDHRTKSPKNVKVINGEIKTEKLDPECHKIDRTQTFAENGDKINKFSPLPNINKTCTSVLSEPLIVDSTLEEMEHMRRLNSPTKRHTPSIGWNEDSVAPINCNERMTLLSKKDADFDELSMMFTDVMHERDRLREKLSERTKKLKNLEARAKTHEAGKKAAKERCRYSNDYGLTGKKCFKRENRFAKSNDVQGYGVRSDKVLSKRRSL